MTKDNSSKKKDAKAEIDGTNVQGIDRRGRPLDSGSAVETTTTKTRKKKGKMTSENREEDESSSSKAESAETSKVEQTSIQQEEEKKDQESKKEDDEAEVVILGEQKNPNVATILEGAKVRRHVIPKALHYIKPLNEQYKEVCQLEVHNLPEAWFDEPGDIDISDLKRVIPIYCELLHVRPD